MNTKERFALILTLALLGGVALVAVAGEISGIANAPLAPGGSPTVVAYQGEVRVSGAPYNGDGYFKFSVVNAAGNFSYWSNDGSSAGGSEPAAAVGLAVSEGLFSVLLGDTTLGGMTQALTAGVFSHPDRHLRVWFSSSGGGPFDQLTPDTRIAAVPYALQAQEAADADTVDGLHASELETHYQNVVVVAKSGGDYAGVQAAIDSITDAAADNPYLVWVAPGVFEEQVTMKPYVHLQGAGQEATIISSTASSTDWPPAQATLILASDVSLRDLTVNNSGTGYRNVALLATGGVTRTLAADVTMRAAGGGSYNFAILLSGSGVGVMLQGVTALGENGSNSNYGLYNYGSAAATLRGGSFTGRGGTTARGIFNMDSGTTLEAESITTLADEGTSSNYGLYNYSGAVATLRGGSCTGRGGTVAYGIYNYASGSTLAAESVTALGENSSSDNYGLSNYLGVATLRGGSFTGRGGTITSGIYNGISGATLDAESVTALGENGTSDNFGLSNRLGAAATLRGGSFTGRGGTDAWGISNTGSGATLDSESVTALGENGTDTVHGLYSSTSAATLRGGSFTARGGAYSYGIYIEDSGTTLEAVSVTALGDWIGLLVGVDATANVTQSVLEGSYASVFQFNGDVEISNARLVGGGASGDVTCVLVTRGTTVSYDGSTCP